jgi:acetylglutamate kinase
MAQAIAIALSDFFQVKLVYCFEKPGVLRDPQDDHSVIPSINASYFEELKANGTVTAGMIPKLENALKAISKGVHLVRLCLADHLMNENLGTNILP